MFNVYTRIFTLVLVLVVNAGIHRLTLHPALAFGSLPELLSAHPMLLVSDPHSELLHLLAPDPCSELLLVALAFRLREFYRSVILPCPMRRSSMLGITDCIHSSRILALGQCSQSTMLLLCQSSCSSAVAAMMNCEWSTSIESRASNTGFLITTTCIHSYSIDWLDLRDRLDLIPLDDCS